MIGSWMLSCALWSVCMSVAAWLIERVLLTGRVPVRMVWVAAILFTIIGPVATFMGRGQGSARPVAVTWPPPVFEHTVSTTTGNGSGVVRRQNTTTRIPPVLWVFDGGARDDRRLGILWGVLSLAALGYIIGGVLHLRAIRRTWRATTIKGTPVMISAKTGPAVVGLRRPTIVLPERVFSLEPEQLDLMLRHEAEHVAAGDAGVLAASQLAVVVAPWNPLAWWQLRRLKIAVELDCDARVLGATADVGAYGRLLLDMGAPATRGAFVEAGFASHASQLERRIRCLSRRSTLSRRVALSAATVAGVAALAIGCATPAPTRREPQPPVAVAQAPTAPATIDSSRRQPPASNGPSHLAAGNATPADAQFLFDQMQERLQAQPLTPARWAPSITLRRGITSRPRDSVQQSVQQQEERITVQWENAPVSTVLLLIAKVSGRTILPSKSVSGALITANVYNQPWSVVLKSVMNANGFDVIIPAAGPIIVDTYERIEAQRRTAPPARDTLTDSDWANLDTFGCSAMAVGDPSSVVLLISDEDAASGGRVNIQTEWRTGGPEVRFYANGGDRPSHTCTSGGNGILRLFGREALNGSKIVLVTDRPITFYIKTGNGKLVREPLPIERSAGLSSVAPTLAALAISWKPTPP